MTVNGPTDGRPEALIVAELRRLRLLWEELHDETIAELRRLRKE